MIAAATRAIAAPRDSGIFLASNRGRRVEGTTMDLRANQATTNGPPSAPPAGPERVLALIAAGAPPAALRLALDGLVQEQAAERRQVEAQLREREAQYRAIF